MNQVFEIKVGNLLPDETLIVNIRYVQELQNDTLANDLIRFYLPTTIAPRYQGKGTLINEETNDMYTNVAGICTLALQITCRMSGRVLDIKSTTHTITTNLDVGDCKGKIASASLAEGYTFLDKV